MLCVDFHLLHLFTLLLASLVGGTEDTDLRVAFVFAGTARSLKFPIVFETTRENLIGSFCPKLYCTADVFLRVSLTDNTHENGIDAKGTLVQIEDASKVMNEIKYAISRLNPHEESLGGVTEVDWTDIGSEKERKDMLDSPFNSQRHRVIRTLDPRRYSMYFNRWSAYQLAMRREVETGKRYTWVVHVRLDSAWGEPVRAARDWSLDHVHVPDSWASEVPDIFALLPRKWSDSYFCLDALVIPGVMCLGGGNFNPATLKEDYLKNTLHFTPSEVQEAQGADCNHLHRSVDPWNFDPRFNLTWSEMGISEQILKRKLKTFGVDLALKTLSYFPFFTVIIRQMIELDMCIYLHPNHLIGWIRNSQLCQLALWVSCTAMMREFRDLHRDGYKKCTFLPGKSVSGPQCILNPKRTKMNFMPYRLKKMQRCIQGEIGGGGVPKMSSSGRWKASSTTVSEEIVLAPCLSHSLLNDINMTYHYSQMIHFYPNIRQDQEIRVVSESLTPLVYCFTVRPSDNGIELKDCRATNIDKKFQLFSVQTYRSDNGNFGQRKQFVRIEWNHGPEKLCVSIVENTMKTLYATTSLDQHANSIRLRNCPLSVGSSEMKIQRSVKSNFIFQMEKVTVNNYLKI